MRAIMFEMHTISNIVWLHFEICIIIKHNNIPFINYLLLFMNSITSFAFPICGFVYFFADKIPFMSQKDNIINVNSSTCLLHYQINNKSNLQLHFDCVCFDIQKKNRNYYCIYCLRHCIIVCASSNIGDSVHLMIFQIVERTKMHCN